MICDTRANSVAIITYGILISRIMRFHVQLNVSKNHSANTCIRS